MTQTTETLEKLNHLEKMAESIFEEIRKVKRVVAKKEIKKDPLWGLLKGIEISDKDIEGVKKIWDYPMGRK